MAVGGNEAGAAPDTKACPFCAETIKAAAIRCKHCQADLTSPASQGASQRAAPVELPPPTPAPGPRPSEGKGLFKAAFAGFAFAASFALFFNVHRSFCSGPGSPPATMTSTKRAPDEHSAHTAYFACRRHVERRLKSPTSADFPWKARNAAHQGDGRYLIGSHVDAQNSFGATIRTEFLCVIEYRSGDPYADSSWRLVDLTFVP